MKRFEVPGIDVGNRPELQAAIGPVHDGVAGVRLGPRGQLPPRLGRPDEEVHDVLVAPVDQRGHDAVVEIVQPPSGQREAFAGQVDHRRREIDLAVEPGLHRVAVRRLHIDQVGAGSAMLSNEYRFPVAFQFR